MTYRYRNGNTGDEVEYPQPNARLEMLPNWERIAAPAPDPEPEEQQSPVAIPAERPSQQDPKAVWVEYATSRAQDSEEAAEVATLTKAELIDRYGKE